MGRNKFSTFTEQDGELHQHIEALGLKTVEEYRQWCLRNGFSCKLKKDWRQRCRERAAVEPITVPQRLGQQKQQRRNPVELFTGICEGRLKEDDLSQPHLRRLCHAIQAPPTKIEPLPDPDALLRLLLHLHARRVNFFNSTPVIAEFGLTTGNTYLEALALVSAHHQAWIRPCDAWKPRTHNARRQFASLLRHLFARYDDMPLFFDSVWCAGRIAKAAQQRHWYLHVGEGRCIRFCDLPMPLTKRMAHFFKHAPSDLTFEKAIRWSEVIGLGGDERLARAIVGSRLGENFDHDEFWITVIEWLISNPKLDRVHVGPIIDYLHHERFAAEPAQGCREEASPSQPNLTMKGRTAESLLRKVNRWHGKLARSSTSTGRQWSATGIEGFEFIEGSQANGTLKIWTIRELLSSTSLVAEGRAMKHCVAIYWPACVRGQCSIWTMEVETFARRSKVLTIEIQNQRFLIRQARGKANRLPTDKEMGVLRRWAAEAGLAIASSL